MRKIAIGLWAILASICAGAPVRAQTVQGPAWTVQAMYQRCKSQDATDQIECMSYLWGVTDLMRTVQVFRGEEKTADGRSAMSSLAICPGTISGGQLEQVFINWAEAHPTLWQEPRAYALDALRKAWPCP